MTENTRKISKEKYLIAFFITGGIFLLGLFLGLIIENERVQYVQDQYSEQKIMFGSSQLQYEFLTTLEETGDCPVVFTAFYANLEDLESTRIRLEKFANKGTLEKDSLELLEREYLLAEIRYWLLAKKAQELCHHDVVNILYFYSNEDECSMCNEQGFVLSYLKKVFGDKLLIFSFNAEIFEEPMVEILKTAYNVTEYPGLVIDEETYLDFSSTEKLMELICGKLSSDVEECQDYNIIQDSGIVVE
jgi:hypothetical protein